MRKVKVVVHQPFFSPNVSSTPAGGYGYTWNSPYGGPTYQFSQTYTLSPTYTNQNSAQFTVIKLLARQFITADRKATEFGARYPFL